MGKILHIHYSRHPCEILPCAGKAENNFVYEREELEMCMTIRCLYGIIKRIYEEGEAPAQRAAGPKGENGNDAQGAQAA